MFMASCEQKEQPVYLPEPGDAVYGSVDLGEDFEEQVFFDFCNKI